MTMKVKCEFCFHPVGQGLFYSGRIDNFGFVYDCGTASGHQYMRSALGGYSPPRTPLDVLIISHFHRDHISGIQSLLDKTGGVKEVVLPYLFPAERLMVAAGYCIEKGLDSVPRDYAAFLADPVRYLTGRRARSVTYIASGKPVGEGGWAKDGSGKTKRIRWFSKDDHAELGKKKYPQLGETGKSVKIRPHSAIRQTMIWRFKFYCRPGPISEKTIRERLLRDGIDPDHIARTMRDRLEDIKKVYRRLFGKPPGWGQNATSLLCCHGPAVRVSWSDVHLSSYCRGWALQGLVSRLLFLRRMCRGPWVRGLKLANEQMLTGDAEVKTSAYRRHFSREIPRIGLFMLPHHGSSKNWTTAFISLHPNCLLWIYSAGLGNQYRHPDKKVIDALFVSRKFVLPSNEMHGLLIAARGRM